MKILIVNTHLRTGGIRQALCNLVNEVKDLDVSIDLQLFINDQESIEIAKQLKGVTLCPPLRGMHACFIPLGRQKNLLDACIRLIAGGIAVIFGKKYAIHLLLFFVKQTKKYDIAISYDHDSWKKGARGFRGGCNEYVLKKATASRKYSWIHGDPNDLGYTYDFCKRTFQDFDSIVHVSFACKKSFDEIIPEFEHKSKVVYNMCDVERVMSLADEASPYDPAVFNIVTVARMDNAPKRIDRIIDCCELLTKQGLAPKFKWTVVGGGPDLAWLRQAASKKQLQHVIDFVGEKSNPYPYMKYADVFVLTSEYEAMPMVILESLITGTPVITTSFLASRELIQDGKNGMVVPMDASEIGRAIRQALEDKSLLEKWRAYIQSHPLNNHKALLQLKEVIGIGGEEDVETVSS